MPAWFKITDNGVNIHFLAPEINIFFHLSNEMVKELFNAYTSVKDDIAEKETTKVVQAFKKDSENAKGENFWESGK